VLYNIGVNGSTVRVEKGLEGRACVQSCRYDGETAKDEEILKSAIHGEAMSVQHKPETMGVFYVLQACSLLYQGCKITS
jgi:hypothetical protein